MHDPALYGDKVADIYDAMYPTADEAMIDLLAELAAGGPALELGIGSGRVALPLVARGVAVHGVDASPRMIEKLRAKPGGAAIPVTMGDFADLGAVPGGPFGLIYCPFNTFFALLTQDDQLRCFASAAARLAPTGRFAIECFVPDPTRFTGHQAWRALDVAPGRVAAEASRHDPVHQRVDSNVLFLREGEPVSMVPISIRYAWPAELDLMARLAGLRLAHRWGGWRKQPFGASANVHVSVYTR